MSSERFVYVTYFAAKPEMIWNALFDGELTRQHWKHENVSDWKTGSKWEHVSGYDKRTVKLTGKVLE